MKKKFVSLMAAMKDGKQMKMKDGDVMTMDGSMPKIGNMM